MGIPQKQSFLSLLVVLCLLSITGYAQKPKYPAYVGHVNDFANVIDPATETRLETILTNFENLTGTQIAAVIVPSLNDRPIEEYAEGLYETWGIGAKSGPNKNKGALLIVSIGDRRSRIETGYALEGDLPDVLAWEVLRRMQPSLKQAQYGQAMEIGVRSIVDTLAERWNVNVAGIDRQYVVRQPQPPAPPSGKAILIMFGVFLFFIIMMSIIARKARRQIGRATTGAAADLWWLAPIIFNRGGGSFGGGSWNSSGGWGGGGSSSGGDSGGSWGGFGGGDSGGGGASDSW